MSVRKIRSRKISSPDILAVEGVLGRLLDPIDRLGETIFAVLMMLTFTLAFAFLELDADPSKPVSVADVHELLIGIAGATLAWGLIDGVLYALISVFERGEKHRLLTGVQKAETREEGITEIGHQLDHILEPITQLEKRQRLYADILDHLKDSQPQRVKLTGEDLLGAIGCVLMCLIAVLPSMVPLALLPNHFDLAIRISNMISFIVLFLAGYHWGKYSGIDPFKTGLLLLVIGIVLALVAIPLGG
jgi:hypothetical protein